MCFQLDPYFQTPLAVFSTELDPRSIHTIHASYFQAIIIFNMNEGYLHHSTTSTTTASSLSPRNPIGPIGPIACCAFTTQALSSVVLPVHAWLQISPELAEKKQGVSRSYILDYIHTILDQL